jgi:hypothetical protein
MDYIVAETEDGKMSFPMTSVMSVKRIWVKEDEKSNEDKIIIKLGPNALDKFKFKAEDVWTTKIPLGNILQD